MHPRRKHPRTLSEAVLDRSRPSLGRFPRSSYVDGPKFCVESAEHVHLVQFLRLEGEMKRKRSGFLGLSETVFDRSRPFLDEFSPYFFLVGPKFRVESAEHVHLVRFLCLEGEMERKRCKFLGQRGAVLVVSRSILCRFRCSHGRNWCAFDVDRGERVCVCVWCVVWVVSCENHISQVLVCVCVCVCVFSVCVLTGGERGLVCV